ncbi:acyl transferase/acyl hydrolase/lysophospholipase, partial [Schizophyllum commune]
QALGPSSSFSEKESAERKAAAIHDIRSLRVKLPKPGIRLLSFDDGGARGFSMLLMLRDMLAEIEFLTHETALPCEFFDIIAGSGIGGFLALLLGRLRLSIDDAIECYTRVVERVFMRTKNYNFKTAPFEDVLREISNRFGDGDDTDMMGERGPQCKTFVCIREDDPPGMPTPRRLRTYAHPAEPATHYTLIQAIRATMGNPVFFQPATITRTDGSTMALLDAGPDHCNPSFDLLEEAYALYPSRNIAYILSLGAGRANTIDAKPWRGLLQPPRLPSSCLTTMQDLARRCDAIAEAFTSRNPELQAVYFRFSHDKGSVDGKMAQWEQLEVLKGILRPYVDSVDEQSFSLVRKMMHERSVLAGRSTW